MRTSTQVRIINMRLSELSLKCNSNSNNSGIRPSNWKARPAAILEARSQTNEHYHEEADERIFDVQTNLTPSLFVASQLFLYHTRYPEV